MTISSSTRDTLRKFCAIHHITHHDGWKNFTRNIDLPKTITMDVEGVEDLSKLFRLVNHLNTKNKASGEKIITRVAAGGRTGNETDDRYSQSFSLTAGAAADVVVHLHGSSFQQVELIDKANKIVRVGAGVQVGELGHTLFYDFQLALPTSSLIPWPTFSGLVANGGHGTGRDQPGVAGLVVAMTIMRPDGSVVRIDRTHPDFETIRGSHLGLFGVVLDMDVQCIEAKRMECTLQVRNLYQLEKEIEAGLYKDNEYVSVMYVPTYRDNETKESCEPNVIIMCWKPVPLDTPKKGKCIELERLGQKLSIMVDEAFHIPELLGKHPHLLPFFMQYFVSASEIGKTDKKWVVDWPDAAQYRWSYPWNLKDADQLFNVSNDGHQIINVLHTLSEKLKKYADQGTPPISYGVYLRYFKGTNGGMSPSFSNSNEHVCGFDMTSAQNIQGFDEFKNEMKDYMMHDLHSRPHWGKDVPMQEDYAKIYGQSYKDFMSALERWHQKIKMPLTDSPLINPFFENILKFKSYMSLTKDETFLRKENVAIPTPSATSIAGIIKQVLNYLKKQDDKFSKNACGKALENECKTIQAKSSPTFVAINKNTLFAAKDSKEERQEKKQPAFP